MKKILVLITIGMILSGGLFPLTEEASNARTGMQEKASSGTKESSFQKNKKAQDNCQERIGEHIISALSEKGRVKITERKDEFLEFLWYDERYPLAIDILEPPGGFEKVIYLLPGSGSNFQSNFFTPIKDNIARYLAEKGYLVIGITPREDRVPYILKRCRCFNDWGLEKHREDVRKVIETVENVISLPYEMLGFSAGAVYALDYAASYSDKDKLLERIVLLGSIGEFDPDNEKELIDKAVKSEKAVKELISRGVYTDDSMKQMKLLAIFSTAFPYKDSGIKRNGYPGNFTLEGLAYFSLIHTNQLEGPTTKFSGLPEQWYYKEGLCYGKYTFSDDPRKDSYKLYNTDVSVIKKAALKIRSGLFPQRANLEIFSILHRGEEYSIDFGKIECAVLWINSEFGLGSYNYSVKEIINSGNSDVKFFLIKGYSHADLIYGKKAREDVWNLIT